MADYTITTTPDQESLLQWIAATTNREHDSQLTVQEFVTMRFAELLRPYEAQYREALLKQVQDLFAAAPAATQQQIKSLLGLT